MRTSRWIDVDIGERFDSINELRHRIGEIAASTMRNSGIAQPEIRTTGSEHSWEGGDDEVEAPRQIKLTMELPGGGSAATEIVGRVRVALKAAGLKLFEPPS